MKEEKSNTLKKLLVVFAFFVFAFCGITGLGVISAIITPKVSTENSPQVAGVSTKSDNTSQISPTIEITNTEPEKKVEVTASISQTPTSTPTKIPVTSTPKPTVIKTAVPTSNTYNCGVKKNCSQVSSCSEAYQQLACGNKDLDRDNDGIPCESICL